jgi:alginate O-acetyltransferase complex protein AlgI
MLFCSAEFALFFSVIFVAYWLLPSRRGRALLLLLALGCCSYLDWKYLTTTNVKAWTIFLTDFAKAIWPSLAHVQETGSPFGSMPALPGNTVVLPGIFWLSVILAIALTLAYRLGHDKARVWLLLLASFYFYASWNQWLALLICVSTAMDYLIARGLDHPRSSAGWRKLLLGISLVANLGLLVYFKYANFFLQSLEDSLRAAGITVSMPLLQVILPIGISFYTFEAINYTVDVYRRRVPAERSLAHFMLFITFFPHLVAGPIVRARDFLPQTHRRKRWDWARLELGARYFLMGLFKKWAIADRMAQYVDPVFSNPSVYSTTATWLAVIAYALQIYGDFSGYSDMALGTAHMLGYKLAQNFNMPYLATNLSEFWRRWHISLSSWLRDYLFIPLGGSRGTRGRTCLNLMITMTLGGLWHGASWTFVIWGILHGGLLVVHRYFRDFCDRRPWLIWALQSAPGTALRMAVTLLCVMICWVFFRANATPPEVSPHLSAFQVAGTVLHHMAILQRGEAAPLHNRSLWYTVLVVVFCHVLAQSGIWKKLVVRTPAPVLGFGYAFVLTVAMVLAPDAGKAFIYFQF